MAGLFGRRSDPSAETRFGGIGKGFKQRERKHFRHPWRSAIALVLVLLLAGAGYVWYRYERLKNEIQAPIPEVEPPANEEDPLNVLVVGSDSRSGLTETEKQDLAAGDVEGERADTLILAHIDPADDTIVMVQFPRDLLVRLPEGDRDRVNSALQHGDDYMVETVEELTGLSINRYVKANIAGFREIVDAIGGVTLCMPEPIPFDPNTGFEITPEQVGLYEFDGDTALRFVRSRKNVENGDFGRIANQQRFLSAAINKLISTETIFNPSRINAVLNAAGRNITTDLNTEPRALLRLANRLKAFDPERYEAYIVPNRGIAEVDGASVVLPDRPAMDVLFSAIGRNESPAEADGVPGVAPSTIEVGVYSTHEDVDEDVVAEDLVQATDTGAGPVVVATTGSTVNSFGIRPRPGLPEPRTAVVTYNPRKPETRRMAELVAAAISEAEVRPRPRPAPGLDVTVWAGPRFGTERLIQLQPLPIPKPAETPEVCRR